jgi:hypothetical protein
MWMQSFPPEIAVAIDSDCSHPDISTNKIAIGRYVGRYVALKLPLKVVENYPPLPLVSEKMIQFFSFLVQRIRNILRGRAAMVLLHGILLLRAGSPRASGRPRRPWSAPHARSNSSEVAAPSPASQFYGDRPAGGDMALVATDLRASSPPRAATRAVYLLIAVTSTSQII